MALQCFANKVCGANVTRVLFELFKEDLVRGRGLLVRVMMRSQRLSNSLSCVFATCVSHVCRRLPSVGALASRRLVVQFRRSYRLRNFGLMVSSSLFLAHLARQGVVHVLLIYEILILLLNGVDEWALQIAVTLMQEVCIYLFACTVQAFYTTMERFRKRMVMSSTGCRTRLAIEGLIARVSSQRK